MKGQSRSCPICKRPVPEGEGAKRHHPFCSKRCADIDLSRWLAGVYAIPATASEDATQNGVPDGEPEGDIESEPKVRH